MFLSMSLIFFLVLVQPRKTFAYISCFFLRYKVKLCVPNQTYICHPKLHVSGKACTSNTRFTVISMCILAILTLITWLSFLLLYSGDKQPNPGPSSISSISSAINPSNSSDISNDIISSLSIICNLSFVQYNVQNILNKLDILQTELFEFYILAFRETWLNQSISSDDLLFQSFNRPERKDRAGDSHGGVMIYVKEGIYYKCRDDLEIRGIECI